MKGPLNFACMGLLLKLRCGVCSGAQRGLCFSYPGPSTLACKLSVQTRPPEAKRQGDYGASLRAPRWNLLRMVLTPSPPALSGGPPAPAMPELPGPTVLWADLLW